ncbi:putative ribonuclease H-like domain-containing protein [Tanacetum coccineum]
MDTSNFNLLELPSFSTWKMMKVVVNLQKLPGNFKNNLEIISKQANFAIFHASTYIFNVFARDILCIFGALSRLNTVGSSINAVSFSLTTGDPGREKAQRNEFKSMFGQEKDANGNSIYRMFTPVSVVRSSYDNLGRSIPVNAATLPNTILPTDPLMPDLEDINDLQVTRIFNGATDDEVKSVVVDFNNLELTIVVSPIPISRIYKDHPKDYIKKQRRTNYKDYQKCLFSCFLSQIEPKKVTQALTDPNWIEAMKDEFLQFRLQKVWRLVDLPNGKHAIRTKWVYRNKKDDREIVVRNKARLVAQGYTQEEGINYDEVFAHVAKIEAISQDKYVVDILKKFDFATVNTASTPMEPNKELIKDEEADSVDVHLYRSMIGSLMYLTASRPDITFAVCACERDSPFDLEAFSNSDYARASLDKKSTIGGCQFLSKRLISWQCKKQTIVANSTTEAEYVAAANFCGHVLWIQNQMLDYGFNFMNTKIFIDNESTICIVKNPVFHSKTKHIEIRHHFIRDCYEKKLIQVIKIYTNHNIADLLTKAFDVSRFNFLIASIGLLNL